MSTPAHALDTLVDELEDAVAEAAAASTAQPAAQSVVLPASSVRSSNSDAGATRAATRVTVTSTRAATSSGAPAQPHTAAPHAAQQQRVMASRTGLNAEELQLKRDLAIRDIDRKWAASTNEQMLQRRMLHNWTVKERETRLARAREERHAQHVGELKADAERRARENTVEARRVEHIAALDHAWQQREAERARQMRQDAAAADEELRTRLAGASQERAKQIRSVLAHRPPASVAAAAESGVSARREAAIAAIDAAYIEKSNAWLERIREQKAAIAAEKAERDARIRASREEAARRRAQALLRAAEAKALTDEMNIQREENYQLMLRERAERRAEGAAARPAGAAPPQAPPAGGRMQPAPPPRGAEPAAPSAPRTPGPRSARLVAAHS